MADCLSALEEKLRFWPRDNIFLCCFLVRISLTKEQAVQLISNWIRIAVLIAITGLLVTACSSDTESTNPDPELPAPVMLDELIPAGEIAVGEVAVIVLPDPMNWVMTNNSLEIVELTQATDDGQMQTNYFVTALKLGTANLYAEKDGLGQAFTIEVVANTGSKTLQIGDSDFSLRVPNFLADRIEFVIQMDQTAAELEAFSAVYIYYKAEDGENRFGSFAWVLPIAKWEEIQNPNEPPLGSELVRTEDRVLVISHPQDLPFNDRYSNDANRYGALVTLLRDAATFSYTPAN